MIARSPELFRLECLKKSAAASRACVYIGRGTERWFGWIWNTSQPKARATHKITGNILPAAGFRLDHGVSYFLVNDREYHRNI
jgi:hypothetical protein